MSTSGELLCGLDDAHVVEISAGQRIHHQAFSPFLALQQAAAEAGHNLQIASGFRDYHRQAAIWQRKVSAASHHQATPEDKALHHIMRWSALPGASRHHWGTDMDVYDPDVLEDGKLQLEPWEYASDGPLGPLFQWLQANARAFGFFWPYARDLGGVACEPWHLSFAPLALTYQQQISPALLLKAWHRYPPAQCEWLQHHLDSLFSRYVSNVCNPR